MAADLSKAWASGAEAPTPTKPGETTMTFTTFAIAAAILAQPVMVLSLVAAKAARRS
jgi:hypothetical protein